MSHLVESVGRWDLLLMSLIRGGQCLCSEVKAGLTSVVGLAGWLGSTSKQGMEWALQLDRASGCAWQSCGTTRWVHNPFCLDEVAGHIPWPAMPLIKFCDEAGCELGSAITPGCVGSQALLSN